MIVFAIDPGTTESGYAFVDTNGYVPYDFGKIDNDELMRFVAAGGYDALVVEMVAHYGSGMPAGKEVFDTVRWIGRFEQEAFHRNKRFQLIYRIDERMDLCGHPRAKDANIRQALIDRFAKTKSGKGTKKDPDFFYGFSKDAWSAFAVAVVYIDEQRGLYVSKVEDK